MTTVLIVVVGLLFFGMGCVAIAKPSMVALPFGMTFEGRGDAARAEVRAVYGGFGLAMAAMLAVAVVNDSARTGIVITVGAALAGMALGRVLSAVLGDRTRFYPNWFYFVVEIVAAAGLYAAV